MTNNTKSNFEKLNIWTWIITPAIILGLSATIMVTMKMNNISMPFANKNMVALFQTYFTEQTFGIGSAFMLIGGAMLRGAIFGGLFASIHNFVRKFFN